MELMTLDGNLQPNKLVENYQSLVWTERYSSNGDFELVSTEVDSMVGPNGLLPLESFVCLRESSVPMVVEIHKIEKVKNAAPRVTILGRSLETVLERRASVNQLMLSGLRTPWMIPAAKESDAAFLAMRRVLGDTDQYLDGSKVLPAVSPAIDPDDAIDQIRLTLPQDYEVVEWSSTVTYSPGDVVGIESGSDAGMYAAASLAGNQNKSPVTNPTYWTKLNSTVNFYPTPKLYEIKPQDLYKTVVELLQTSFRGLKATRPMPGDTAASIEIYNGADLTNIVQFDARFDQFDSATYLLSNRGSADIAYVYGSNGADQVVKSGSGFGGLLRRVLVVDNSGDANANSTDARTSRGLIELYKNNVTALFDGQISTQVAAGYNRDYFLGDIIQLVGEYGLYEDVRVVEFIRTSDSTGEKAYPTFAAVEVATAPSPHPYPTR
jgi:hypothetical protein